MINQIIQGDCVKLMSEFPAEFIDLTVTSPPYDHLRNYEGYNFSFPKTAEELFRVTKTGGIVVWVVNDASVGGSETGTSFRQALFFKKIGFRIHDTMIYEKANPKPLPSKRYQQCFEYMMVFSKGVPKVFNPIRVPSKYAGIKMHGRYRSQDNQLHDFSGNGRPVQEMRMKKNIWTYAVGGGNSSQDSIALQHPAIFPEKLAEDHILSWSNPGDLVLDPMCGSGTTCKMAKKNNRNFIGIDMSSKYCHIARVRTSFNGSREK